MNRTLNELSQRTTGIVPEASAGEALDIALEEDRQCRAARAQRVQRHVDRAYRLCCLGMRGVCVSCILVLVWIVLAGLAERGGVELRSLFSWIMELIVLVFAIGTACEVAGGIAWLGWLRVAHNHAMEVRAPDVPDPETEAEDAAAR